MKWGGQRKCGFDDLFIKYPLKTFTSRIHIYGFMLIGRYIYLINIKQIGGYENKNDHLYIWDTHVT